MVNGLISNVNLEDVQSQTARPFKAAGVIGVVEQRTIANGYTQIAVPITYRLNPSDSEDRHFTARFNVKQEWLTPEFTAMVNRGDVTGTEKIQYEINVKGLLKGLFSSAGVRTGAMNFDSLAGRSIGFKTKVRKDDPSRLDISFFYAPR